jgi:hypothetical protein
LTRYLNGEIFAISDFFVLKREIWRRTLEFVEKENKEVPIK